MNLFDAEAPEVFAGGAGIEVGVVARIGVAANVDHPHVEPCKLNSKCFKWFQWFYRYHSVHISSNL